MSQVFKFRLVERIVIVILAFTLIILISARAINYYSHVNSINQLFLSIVSVLLFLLLVLIIKWFNELKYINWQLYTRQKICNTMEETLKLMRTERHEFINHLQCIYALILSGEHTRAKEYINEVNNDSRFNSQVLNINNPIIRAILQSKKQQAEKLGISLKLEVCSTLEYFVLKDSDISSIFGNLLDNAIDVLKTANNKEIVIKIEETENDYCFMVIDTAPLISVEVIEKMFQKGYSTKGNDRGFGLWLVKSIVESNNGKVTYDQYLKKVFNVIIPKNKRGI